MIQIVECTEDILKNVPNVIELLYQIYGAKTIALFAVFVDDKLCFVARDGANCVYIHGEGYNHFTINENDELGALRKDDIEIFFGDDLYFVDANKIEHHVELIQLPLPDDMDYDGCVAYKQYNPSNDTMCEIRYQHMYNESNGRARIYGYHTQKIDCLYIDEEYTNKPKLGRGILPNRSKYYAKVEFDEDMIGYNWIGIREYGLINFLQKGPYQLQMAPTMVRYARTKYIGSDGNYHDFWPLGEQLKPEELKELISSYGFNTELPWQMIEIYNGNDRLVNTVSLIVEEMKGIVREVRKSQESEKVILLSLRTE